MLNNILVVCVGNVCRSPVGERLLAQSLPEAHVSSAGMGALANHPADPTMTEVAQSHGLSLEGHIARQIQADMIREADLVLVMEAEHLAHMMTKWPFASGKVFQFDKWSGGAGVPDPYRKSHEYHETVYNLLEQAASAWIKRLTIR